MKDTVPLAEAKNRLSELIDRVVRGEEVTITRHDKEVAKLVPVNRRNPAEALEKIARFRKFREKNILNPPGAKQKLTTRDLVNEGRKY
jgi:prevent-host-death family protein